MATEVEWLTSQSEYRPTEYLHGWLRFWFNDEQRLTAAKTFQQTRIKYLEGTWKRDRDLKTKVLFLEVRQFKTHWQPFMNVQRTPQKRLTYC